MSNLPIRPVIVAKPYTSDLIRTLASDAVTKKIRYRFIGVGNGRYTIELIKQPLLTRLNEKIERSLQLLDVFDELESELGITLGKVEVAQGDARSSASWPALPEGSFIVTSPPYLPASSGREHYASSRALAFAVLGFAAGADGYFDNAVSANPVPTFPADTEAGRLMIYLCSDATDNPDPQKDAMRFERKAVPTAHYLEDLTRFGAGLTAALEGSVMAMVVADQHTFYSHRRSEVEHVVDCASLYGELLREIGLDLTDEIELQLLKSAASRAKPRSTDDYHEAVLVFSVGALRKTGHLPGSRPDRAVAAMTRVQFPDGPREVEPRTVLHSRDGMRPPEPLFDIPGHEVIATIDGQYFAVSLQAERPDDGPIHDSDAAGGDREI